jgi:hypothetical protein
MPVRKSAQTMKPVLDQVAKFPAYGVAMKEISPTAKPETSVRGTQETRDAIESAMTAALADVNKSPKALLDEAQSKAQKALEQ